MPTTAYGVYKDACVLYIESTFVLVILIFLFL